MVLESDIICGIHIVAVIGDGAMTGGMAYDAELVAKVKENTEWIAPVYVYPGSFETEALGAGVERVLSGEEEVKIYSGEPVWKGFDFE